MGPFSPLLEYEGNRLRQQRAVQETREVLGQLTFQPEAETWALSGGPALNGLRHERIELAQGDVVEAGSQLGPWQTWVVRFPAAAPRDTGLGPLWLPFHQGAFTLDEASEGQWHGVLRAGCLYPRRASLDWLSALVASDFASRLETLELHLSRADEARDWPAVVADHLALSQRAPFELRLLSPAATPGAEPLPSLHCADGAAEVSLSAYGSGLRWNNHAPLKVALRDGRANGSKGWVSLAAGDWLVNLEAGDQRLALLPSLPAPRTSPRAAQQDVTPWVLIPATQAHFPLTFDRGDWLLRLDGTVQRYSLVDDALRWRRPDEQLQPLPWFTPHRLPSSPTVVFLPGPSPFLAGARRLAAGAPLTPARVSVFVDELAEAGDLAAEGLAAIAAGHSEGHRWHARLLAPWARPERAVAEGGLDPAEGEHVGGFFTSLRVGPWLDFHRDVPVLLSHPLLSRLERLAFTTRAGGMRDAEFERTRAALAAVRPGLEVRRLE